MNREGESIRSFRASCSAAAVRQATSPVSTLAFHDCDARSLTTCWPPRPEPREAHARAHCRRRGFVTFPRPLSSDSSIKADPASESFRKVETTSESPAKSQRLDQLLRVRQLEPLHERSRVLSLTSIHQQRRNVGVNTMPALQPFLPNRPDETK